MKYKSVVVTQKGAPDVLKIVENDLREPAAGEARIKVLATSVGGTDIAYRNGTSPLAPKIPFVPGYEILGIVDALGAGVANIAVGDRVAALTGHGGNSEYIYLAKEHLVPVPPSLDAAEAVILVLNYVTAYQMLHRIAKVKAGDKVLVVGASGGVGTALLELGKLANLKMYGTASTSKHSLLTRYGAIPIDYHSQDFVQAIRQAEPAGLDFVFDGVGGDYFERSFGLLRKGGKLVEFAIARGWSGLVFGLARIALLNLLPNGKSVAFYGISAVYASNKRPFMEDLPLLFKMLSEGQIKPVIAEKLPFLETARGHALLENGKVSGNIVLLAPELI
ncbi:MAG TPA: medium chain dehydrogenase/reductase family protein [Anaerolineaceae bacterium]|nr:medium chain dehydrogenase/reductase family protein [Anaerolineaceae bacterium]